MSEISQTARASELRRQALQSRVTRAARVMPPALSDYLKTLAASVVGFWVLTELLAYFSPAEALYTLPALGLLFAGQATHYKLRLARDPDFEVPDCGCGGRRDDTATVLRSKESATLGVPNSAIALVLYAALLVAVAAGRDEVALVLAAAAALASAYLAYVMVFRLASLCSTCVNVAAVNVLILLQLLR